MENNTFRPDYLFEVSWEICNKVGGIHTAISSRSRLVSEKFNDNYILIGPDVWKETRNNPEFIEEPYLFRAWKRYAESSGIKVKTGRWNIPGTPIVFLVDFTPLFSQKDKIFYDYWEKYQLDSIAGQWSYVEPSLFGHAAAQVIENFYDYNLTAKNTLVVHFHDWTTGTGVLYLDRFVPQASTVYTAYATNVGRSMASQYRTRYNAETNADEESTRLGVRAQHSLERLAVKHADTFTTLSAALNDECTALLKRTADFIIPNGLDFKNLPDENTYNEQREKARNKIRIVAEALTNQAIDEKSVFLLHSGLYDFQNKGTDVFIQSLVELNKETKENIVVVICLPGNQTGPRTQVIERIHNCDYTQPILNEYLTHNLKDETNDPVIHALRESGLKNSPEDKVKVVFIPCYLNGEDGIFNISYHQLLPGFDLTVLPSFYDSWSHTPMESISLSVPTITSDLTGFGRFTQQASGSSDSVMIVKRSELSFEDTIKTVSTLIQHYISLTPEARTETRKQASVISHIFNWENFLAEYCASYEAACKQSHLRFEQFKNKQISETFIHADTGLNKMPVWKKVFIKSYIPERLYPLQIIAKNMWWSWNYDAQELYERIDSNLWEEVNRNPILMIESLTVSKFAELEKNASFLEKLDAVYSRFTAYMNTPTPDVDKKIAYFSMEYGLHDSVKIYSGGLGVLAGDYLKEASDSNKPIVAIGLLYRYGYFSQSLSVHGEQLSNYIPQKFTNLPLIPVRDEKNEWVVISFGFPGRIVYAKVWKIMVGRVPLYLLDTDIPENNEQDRSITHQLYGGDWENRLKQEIILGIGGVKLLRTLDIKPHLYHCNEGHAALLSLERLKLLVEKHFYSFNEAVEIIRATTLFTTHTPVPAGHDAFTEDLIRTYLSHYADKINIEWNKLVGMGRVNESDSFEKFSMSVLAAKLSGEINGVSRIHGKVTRQMFNNIWEGYYPEELHIKYVTNGVHFPTWVSRSALELYHEYLDENIEENQQTRTMWQKIHEVPDAEIWSLRQQLRKNLFVYLRRKQMSNLQNRQESPKLTLERIEKLNENYLTIGFARRFATYKRAHLIFSNLKRLSLLVNNPQRPIQFIFAGKAHPSDKAGQDIIKRIVEISQMPEFIGRIVFMEDYDMDLAKMLIQGVDVWLNNPTRPLEASGTSGEKAIMNGVVNCSVLDGWWAEGYVQGAGWALKEERTYQNQDLQDELDAETLYHLFENEIAPAFYNRNASGVPEKWVSHVKNTISEIAPQFTMRRQLDDYYEKFYTPMLERRKALFENECDAIKNLSNWKQKILHSWDSIEVVSVEIPDSTVKPLMLNETFKASIVLNLHELDSKEIGVEIVFGQKEFDVVKTIHFVEEMKASGKHNGCIEYSCNISIMRSGVFDYSFRVFPRHPLLKYRQDFPVIKWI